MLISLSKIHLWIYSKTLQVVVPKTYNKYTSRKVLTTQWIEGEKLSQSTEDDVGSLVSVGVICYLKQVRNNALHHLIHSIPILHDWRYACIEVTFFKYICCYLQLLDTGFFHADPHPGNMIRTPDGKLAILDFGMSTSSMKNPQITLMFSYGILCCFS